MLGREESKERRVLRRLLSRWRGVVELSARGLGDDPQKYAALHRELLQSCRALADASGDEPKGLYEAVEKLVRPWLRREALIQSKQDILLEVLKRCRQAERDLGGPSWWEVGRHWLRTGTATLAGGTILGMLVWMTVRWRVALRTLFKGARFEISMALDRLGTKERWMLAGAIAIVVVIVMLSRTAKS